jgi:hypothetical protein
VAPKVHSVVEDARDFDRAVRRGPVHQEMASTTAAPRNVESDPLALYAIRLIASPLMLARTVATAARHLSFGCHLS